MIFHVSTFKGIPLHTGLAIGILHRFFLITFEIFHQSLIKAQRAAGHYITMGQRLHIVATIGQIVYRHQTVSLFRINLPIIKSGADTVTTAMLHH